MASVTQWELLLGLPVETALERARAAGVEPTVIRTCAPRRGEPEPAERTERVIRVSGGQELILTVSAFVDGDPRRGN